MIFMPANITIKIQPQTASDGVVERFVEKNVKKWNKVENYS